MTKFLHFIITEPNIDDENLPYSKTHHHGSRNSKHFTTLACSIVSVFLFVGESGLGKSTLIKSLFLTDLYKDRKVATAQGQKISFNKGEYIIYTCVVGSLVGFFFVCFRTNRPNCRHRQTHSWHRGERNQAETHHHRHAGVRRCSQQHKLVGTPTFVPLAG